jgi:hypothetical protein
LPLSESPTTATIFIAFYIAYGPGQVKTLVPPAVPGAPGAAGGLLSVPTAI